MGRESGLCLEELRQPPVQAADLAHRYNPPPGGDR